MKMLREIVCYVCDVDRPRGGFTSYRCVLLCIVGQHGVEQADETRVVCMRGKCDPI